MMKNLELKYVKIITLWLAPQDYPTLLGCADLGVCLHASSSGIDLPMKVVDMFGCGLPVCALYFKCIGELVEHDKNGLLFSSAEELASQIYDLLIEFPFTKKLDQMRDYIKHYQQNRWEDNWIDVALSLFQHPT